MQKVLAVSFFVAAFAFGNPCTAQTTCGWNPDSNGDYVVTITDLLALLSVFEEADADMDGIFDSQDDCVGVIDACGVCNGAGVDIDADGICDDADSCVGILDACGVCNGPGPTVPVIDEIVYVTDSLFVPPLGSWYVFSYAVDTLYTYLCPPQGCTDATAGNFDPEAILDDGSCTYGPAQCGGQSSVTFDGHTYNLVGIGEQCWFKENLRSDHYRNGDPIPGNLQNYTWSITGTGAQAVYEESSSHLERYGRLYNWFAVSDPRQLCPVGFKVPNDLDFQELEVYLGMDPAQAQTNSISGERDSGYVGNKLKSSAADYFPWNGTNSNGFSAQPAGSRTGSPYGWNPGSFSAPGNWGGWWTSSNAGGEAFFRSVQSALSSVGRGTERLTTGYSVRCMLDINALDCQDDDGDGVCLVDEVYGCTINTATNFNPSATENDNSCEFNSPSPCDGTQTIEYQNLVYELVEIGNQCWFRQNLNAEHYSNGDAINSGLDDTAWSETQYGAQAVYGEGESWVNPTDLISGVEFTNAASFGRLYNHYAVQDPRGLCPVGFHVPSDEEWMQLEIAIGMTEEEAIEWIGRGTDEGYQLKSSPEDAIGWDGSNSWGFSGTPGGERFNEGSFGSLGGGGKWWTSSALTTSDAATYRYLSLGYNQVYRLTDQFNHGLSVRCLKNVVGDSCYDPDMDGICGDAEIGGCSSSSALNYDPNSTQDDGTCEFPQLDVCNGQATVTFDDYTYNLVGIGTQCWFKENLQSDNYRNGDPIPGDLNDADWTAATAGSQAVYNNEATYLSQFGRLYNWHAVNDSRGLCPTGFKVPGDSEWNTLSDFLGGESIAGTAIKASPSDAIPWDGTNSSGFSALPAGYRRGLGGDFSGVGATTNFWTTEPYWSSAWRRRVTQAEDALSSDFIYQSYGLSVRCVAE